MNIGFASERSGLPAKTIRFDRKIAELASLRRLLRGLVDDCHGDEKPDCPIIEGLGGQGMAQ